MAKEQWTNQLIFANTLKTSILKKIVWFRVKNLTKMLYFFQVQVKIVRIQIYVSEPYMIFTFKFGFFPMQLQHNLHDIWTALILYTAKITKVLIWYVFKRKYIRFNNNEMLFVSIDWYRFFCFYKCYCYRTSWIYICYLDVWCSPL